MTPLVLHDEPVTPALAARRALVVDDDPVTARLFTRLLEAAGWFVGDARGGSAALAELEVVHYDVILSDIDMPGVDGIEFLRLVRLRDADLPVVLITGGASLATAIAAVEHGAFRYLVKPVPPALILETARRAADLHRLARLRREAYRLAASAGQMVEDRAVLGARFERALERLSISWQPIMSVAQRRTWGYEALVRSGEPTLASATALLQAAERLGRVHDIGRGVRARVAAEASQADPEAVLFVNLHAQDLEDAHLFDAATAFSAIARRVILEVTERAPLDSVPDLRGKVQALRALGFRIAVDDLGAGYSGLSAVAQIEPDVVKLDRSLVEGVASHAARQSVIRGMSAACAELGILVLGEGVEQVEERDALRGLGCQLLQGFLFAHPGPGFGAAVW